MSHQTVCTIVPEHILTAIVSNGVAPSEVIDACRGTIDRTRRLGGCRARHQESLLQGRTHHGNGSQRSVISGIVPPHLLNNMHETQRATEAAAGSHGSLPVEEPRQSATAPKKSNLKRTIYDAQHTQDEEELPRNKVLIKEGGPLISTKQDPSNDPNEAYIGFKKTYDFYFNIFKRDSLDGKGLPLDGFVHFGVKYVNAFFDGKQMIFGDGDGTVFGGFTDCLEVIGHELSHGFLENTSPLAYSYQSGALNESIADVFGIMVKQLYGSDQPQTAAQASWIVGEGIFVKGINGRGLRDMANPGTAYDDPHIGKDPQPAHWRDFQKLPLSEDQGGVHINSGIPNRAFYLAATGIGGYAWEGAGAIWYRTLTSGALSEKASFKEFADLTIQNAGQHKAKVQEAWNGVGYPFAATKKAKDEF